MASDPSTSVANGDPDEEAGTASSPQMPRFHLLGPLEIRLADEPVRIGGARQRIVLATLLLDSGRVIPTGRLITAVWDNEPPATARAQIQISISKLRLLLAQLGLPDAIVTSGAGYAAQVPSETVDLVRFRQLVALGRDAQRRGESGPAIAALREALNLWRGDALAGLGSRLLESVALKLNEERLAVLQERLELELASGRNDEVISEVKGLLPLHPLRERLYRQLMLALYRDGRQAEALEVYRAARRVLAEEHGLDPGPELQELERTILASGPTTAAERPVELGRSIPRQLPARPYAFVGRSELLREMHQALAEATGSSPVLVISGPAGVGKTALAIAAAYDASEHYPDGQLFAHLRSYDTQRVSSEQVLDQFVRALGVPPATLPPDREALASLYRSHLVGKRILLLIDDAATAGQVEPLLPASPGIGVIVTSRSLLPGLSNGRRFDLAALPPEASELLLCKIVGEARVKAEPEAAATIAGLCGHLPLALRIAGSKLSARRHWQLARMAHRLGDESRRLDELSLSGSGVRASISVSVAALDAQAAKLFPLLGMLGATDFAVWVAGPLLGVEAHRGADVLEELVEAQLVEVQGGAGTRTRYRLHDLVGVFARELLAAQMPEPERTAARRRLLQCWLFLARSAHQRAYGGDFTASRSTASHWSLPADMVEDLLVDPIGWFDSEHSNLVQAIRLAAELGLVDLCSELAVASATFFEARSHREDWRETHGIALELAVRHQDGRAEAVVRCSRAGLALVEQCLSAAKSDLNLALEWFRSAGDRHGRGLALRGLGSIDRLQGRYQQAERRYEQALNDLRAGGDLVGEAHVLINLAQVYSETGNHGEAEVLLHRALAICTELGARRVVAQTRHRLGQLYLDKGETDLAEKEFTTALETVLNLDDPTGKAYAQLGLGGVWLARGEPDRARDSLAEAWQGMRQAGSRIGEGRVLLLMAETQLRAGDLTVAAQRLREAETAFAEIGAAAWQKRTEQLGQQLRAAQDGRE